MDSINNTRDKQFSFLFEDARKKLDKIDIQAKDQKKQIVVNLAKDLEGKIPMRTICSKIVKRLRGPVSGRFIRECLPQKYKQKAYVENARKQQKQRLQKESKLAVLPPLNQEKKKQIIMLDNDGRESLQKDEHEPPTIVKDSSAQIDEDFIRASHQSESQLKQELNKALEKSSELATADKIVIVEDISYTHKHDNEDSILSFEFSMPCDELQEYMASIPESEGNIKVWFNGRVNLKTGEVISSNLGRLSSSQTASG